jgi:hypothetical protein
MVLLSMIALLQMCVLPGLVMMSVIGAARVDAIKYGVATLFLSVYVNYAVVSGLVLANIYSASAIYAVMVVEIAVLVALRKRIRFIWDISDLREPTTVIFCILLCTLVWLYGSTIHHVFPKIFNDWDDVVSWNRWAVSFFGGKHPLYTCHYPQAIPAWWSIAYVLYGSTLEFLPKAVMPLFLYGGCAMLLEEGAKRKSYGCFASAALMLGYFYRTGYVHSGYVDIPVAMTAFGGLLFLFVAVENGDAKTLVIGALLVIGSGLIKQAGIFMAAVFPVLALFFCRMSGRQRLGYCLAYVVLLCGILGPYYIVAERNIAASVNKSEIAYVTQGIFRGKPVFARLVESMQGLIRDGYILLFLGIPFVWMQRSRLIAALGIVGVAYLCVWGCFYSYDQRNGFLAWPLLLFTGLCAVESVVRRHAHSLSVLSRALGRHRAVTVTGSILLFTVCAMLAGQRINRQWLEEKQDKQKMLRGGGVATFIDSLLAENGIEGKYLSDLQPLAYRSDKSLARMHCLLWSFDSIEATRKKIQADNIGYVCICMTAASEEVRSYFRRKRAEGVIDVLYDDGCAFIRILDRDKM